MTSVNATQNVFNMQGGDRTSEERVAPPPPGTPPDPHPYGPQWASCVSTNRALGLEAGIFVRQLAHWLVEVRTGGTHMEGQRWIWRTYDEWAEEFGWWTAQILRRRVIPSVPEDVLLKRRSRDRGILYSLDFQALATLIEKAGELLPKWLIDATYDPALPPGVQARFPLYKDPHEVCQEAPESSLNNDELLVLVETNQLQVVETDHYHLYRDNSKTNPPTRVGGLENVPERNNVWSRLTGVDPDPPTFFKDLRALYSIWYGQVREVLADALRWKPLRDSIVEWQHRHEALIDPSRARQVIDLMPAEDMREPFDLICAVFRDQMMVRHDMDTRYGQPS